MHERLPPLADRRLPKTAVGDTFDSQRSMVGGRPGAVPAASFSGQIVVLSSFAIQ